MPYVCIVRESFEGIRQALSGTGELVSQLALVEDAVDCRTIVPPEEPPKQVRRLEALKERMKQIDTESMKKKILSNFFISTDNKSKTSKSSPIVVAPTPIVVGRAVAPRVEAMFEIGGEEENEFGEKILDEHSDNDFSSVDLDHH